jgi:hypothetical protein
MIYTKPCSTHSARRKQRRGDQRLLLDLISAGRVVGYREISYGEGRRAPLGAAAWARLWRVAPDDAKDLLAVVRQVNAILVS